MDFSFSKQELEAIYVAVDNLKDDTSSILEELPISDVERINAQKLYKNCNSILRKLKDFKI